MLSALGIFQKVKKASSSGKNFVHNFYSDENNFFTVLIINDYLSVNDQDLITFFKKEEITSKQYSCSEF